MEVSKLIRLQTGVEERGRGHTSVALLQMKASTFNNSSPVAGPDHRVSGTDQFLSVLAYTIRTQPVCTGKSDRNVYGRLYRIRVMDCTGRKKSVRQVMILYVWMTVENWKLELEYESEVLFFKPICMTRVRPGDG